MNQPPNPPELSRREWFALLPESREWFRAYGKYLRACKREAGNPPYPPATAARAAPYTMPAHLARLMRRTKGIENDLNTRPPCLLSVMIPSIPCRAGSLVPLIESLNKQAVGRPVEILSLTDNRRIPTGTKRNFLTSIAAGEFVSHIDDDDSVSPDYVSSILAAIEANPKADVIAFDILIREKRRRTVNEYTLGIDMFQPDQHPVNAHPRHLNAWRRSLALRCPFTQSCFYDDREFNIAARQLITDPRQQAKIEGPPLYIYNYDSTGASGWHD